MELASFAWQRSLFSAPVVSFDAGFGGLVREHLDETAWVDLHPGWIQGADALFEEVVRGRTWAQRSREMYENQVKEPRLTAPWNQASGEPLAPGILDEIRHVLGERYAVEFDSVGFNLYRDGQDSVAWHRDRIADSIPDPIVAIVSLGERRKFKLRPRGGGASKVYVVGAGDLLVTGGATQRMWEHSVPKATSAGPRISLAFRHSL
jgi:alkylated DNA repair dioxygenase AlkB